MNEIIIRYFYCETEEGEIKYTFSCKKTGSDWVSVHEYSVDQFLDVLEIKDGILKDALIEFQECGSIDKLSPTANEALERRLAAYNEKLNVWVLGGVGGPGAPDVQWAQSIISYNENTANVSVMSLADYIKNISKEGQIGNFGTNFRWTYPSGGLGKRIQLKMKVDNLLQ